MMEINLGQESGGVWTTHICFSPDALSYMRLNNANAVIPKKYSKDARSCFFLQDYSNQVNKNKKEQVEGINMKAYTKLDVDDYASYNDNAMYVHGNRFDAPSFNFPNRVHQISIMDSTMFSGRLGYSDLTYNFSFAFSNCKSMGPIFGYPVAQHIGDGNVGFMYYPFRDHYNFEKELADYGINYRKEYGTEEFPGYNCYGMFDRSNSSTNFSNCVTTLSSENRFAVSRTLNNLNYFKMYKTEQDTWDVASAIDNACYMFASCTGFSKRFGDSPWSFDIWVNDARFMFFNATLNANEFVLNANRYDNMFLNTNFIGGSISLIDIAQGGSYLNNMFAGSTISGVASGISISNIATLSTTHMFANCHSFNSNVTVSNFGPNQLPRLANMSYMFYNCYRFDRTVNVPISVTNTAHMYDGCNRLSNIAKAGGGMVSSVYMFHNCTNLSEVLFYRDTVSLINAYGMFKNCNNLANIFASTDPTTNEVNRSDRGIYLSDSLENAGQMFYNCRSLNCNVHLSDGLSYVGGMFANCIPFSNNIYIPQSWYGKNRFGTNMFEYCHHLSTSNIFIGGETVESMGGMIPYTDKYQPFGLTPFFATSLIRRAFKYNNEGASLPGHSIFEYTNGFGTKTILCYISRDTWLNHDFHNSANDGRTIGMDWDTQPEWTWNEETEEYEPPSYNSSPWYNIASDTYFYATDTVPSSLAWITAYD